YEKACVTGGAGFIGTHLVRALVGRGIEVTVLDDLSLGRRERVPPEARLLVGDILDPKAAAEAVRDADIVFHLAARVAIRSSFECVVEDTRTNVVGTAQMLRAAADAGTVRKFIATSTMAVYAVAPDPKPIPESHPTEPISPYGISKLAAERLTHSMARATGMESAVLRLFNTYGPGQTLTPYVGVVTIFVNKLRAGERPTVFGDGEQARDFVHVEDVVQGYLRAMDAAVTGETFNIGSGRPMTVNEVLARLQAILGTQVEPIRAPAAVGELRYSIADVSQARRLLGYEPKHCFNDTVKSVVSEILSDS
ncbi:MAG: NAD-dependent epimerase/dehydratase family protein, partial [Myxococcales bacterium]|nr:NAD-dependent epimerase/dehydratase family protein [Myxococcales bacterium]